MKKLLALLILLAPLYAQAVNYLGFGGGNYVYAEQGNLYFNLEPNVFDNRSWTYDMNVGFSSQIQIKLDLRTQYSSSDWYEQVLANKKSDGLMYANYIKQPFNYQNRGGYQKVVLPAIGWALAGQIARTAAWNSFRGFAARAVGSSASRYLALGTFFSLLTADDIICNENEQCNQTFVARSYYSNSLNEANKIYFPQTLTDKADVVRYVNSRVPSRSVSSSEHTNFNSCKDGGANQIFCTYSDPTNKYSPVQDTYRLTSIQPVTIEQIVQDRDLLKYFDEVCAKFPSECVNEPTNGKNVNDVVLTGGSIGSPVSVVGPPYTNPITGVAQQDKVIIGGASSGIGVNSGTNDQWKYTPTLGQSTTLNPTQVTSIPRPDLTNTDTAPVARPNDKTGGVVATPPVVVPDIKVEIPDFTDIAEFCQQNPKASACIEFEEVEKQNDKELPEIQETFDFNKINIFASNGLCPQGTQFSIGVLGTNKTFEFSYQPACDFAEKLRYVLIAIAMLIALKIVFGFGGVKQ